MNTEEVVLIRAGRLACALSPDSRGYVLIELLIMDDKDEKVLNPISAAGPLCCEHLVDMIDLSVGTVRWVVENCVEITEAGQHLYYRFKTPEERGVPNERQFSVPPPIPKRSLWSLLRRR